MTENIYKTYNIDMSRLKNDYIKNPLRFGEKPYKEDLEYLYIELNLSRDILKKFFNKSIRTIQTYIHYYNLKKPQDLVNNIIESSVIEKYGVKHISQVPFIKERKENHFIEKYGSKTYLNSESGIKHKRELCFEKYGNSNYNNRQKSKQTCLEKYGKESYTQTKEYNNKCINHNLEKYGKEYFTQTKEYKEHYKQTCLQKYGKEYYFQTDDCKEKNKNTFLQKYGKEYYFQTDDCKEKKRKYNINHYGKEYYSQTEEFKNKTYATRKKNNSFTQTKVEDTIFILLKQKYKDVKRQYRSEKYPFLCDFYIPSEDLYIEYQGTWTHGNEPYIGNLSQKEIVKLWENKNSKYYLDAIKTWTERDVLKRKTAKENNLNWVEFFNEIDFEEWYNKLKL